MVAPSFATLLEEFFYRPDEDAGPWFNSADASTKALRLGQNELLSEYLAFTLEGENFAFPIQQTREIVKIHPLTEVPGGGDALLGVINLRGEVLPVYDIRGQLQLLQVPPRNISGPHADLTLVPKTARILIVHGHGEDSGVFVDEIVGVARLTPSSIEAPRRESDRSGVVGLVRWGGRVLILLDAQEIPP